MLMRRPETPRERLIHFEDIEVGQTHRSVATRSRRGDRAYACQFTPTLSRGRGGGAAKHFGGLIASGLAHRSMLMRMVCDQPFPATDERRDRLSTI
jgi:hypothetical protein